MTEDEAYLAMATASGYLDAAGWADFCTLPLPQKKATAQLYRDAVFDKGGEGAWEALLGALGAAATVFGYASGIGQAYFTLKAAL